MILKYGVDIKVETIINDLNRIINQIFKLLPLREEGHDWITPLHNLRMEIIGMNKILFEETSNDLILDQSILFSLLCKMEALTTLIEENDYLDFRKLIFECLNLLKQFKFSFEKKSGG